MINLLSIFKFLLSQFFLVEIDTSKMDKAVSNKTSFIPAGSFAIKNTHEDLGVTQYNSTVVNEFAKLKIEKASNKIDRKALNMFNVFVQKS